MCTLSRTDSCCVCSLSRLPDSDGVECRYVNITLCICSRLSAPHLTRLVSSVRISELSGKLFAERSTHRLRVDRSVLRQYMYFGTVKGSLRTSETVASSQGSY